MKIYQISVIETRVIPHVYFIEAENPHIALEKAEQGEAVSRHECPGEGLVIERLPCLHTVEETELFPCDCTSYDSGETFDKAPDPDCKECHGTGKWSYPVEQQIADRESTKRRCDDYLEAVRTGKIKPPSKI